MLTNKTSPDVNVCPEKEENNENQFVEQDRKFESADEANDFDISRKALRKFVKKTKHLKFKEKMHNVRDWCNRSNVFSNEHPELVENPSYNQDLSSHMKEVNFEKIQ